MPAPKKNAAAKMAPGLNVFLINIGLFINCAGMILDPNRFRRPIQVLISAQKVFIFLLYQPIQNKINRKNAVIPGQARKSSDLPINYRAAQGGAVV